MLEASTLFIFLDTMHFSIEFCYIFQNSSIFQISLLIAIPTSSLQLDFFLNIVMWQS